MGNISKKPVGAPSGAYQDYVFFEWRGKSCFKSRPKSVYDLRSPSQLSRRMRFGLLAKLSGGLSPVLCYGFKSKGRYGYNACTPMNAFVSYNDSINAFSGEGPDEWSIDYKKVVIGYGNLFGFTSTNARLEPMTTDNNIIFTWGVEEEADGSDKVYCVMYNSDLNLCKYGTADRSEGTYTIMLRDEWLQNGKTHLWIFAYNGKTASRSEYLGAMSN